MFAIFHNNVVGVLYFSTFNTYVNNKSYLQLNTNIRQKEIVWLKIMMNLDTGQRTKHQKVTGITSITKLGVSVYIFNLTAPMQVIS